MKDLVSCALDVAGPKPVLVVTTGLSLVFIGRSSPSAPLETGSLSLPPRYAPHTDAGRRLGYKGCDQWHVWV